MKSVILFVLLFSSGTIPRTAPQDLKILVTDLRGSEGHVLISIFNNAKGFPSDTPLSFRKEKVNIENGKAEWVVKDLPAGTYAIVILHDENDNLKLDKRLGIPKEGYGFSNNVRGAMGPPSFAKASFNFSESTEISIRTRY